jgi:hypothetical protein
MRQNGVQIEAREYTRAPIFRILRIDDVMYVSGFVPGIEGRDFPIVRLVRSSDRSMFALFERHFEDIWSSSRRYRPRDDDQLESTSS